mmetsp:Transcript_40075/g.83869  ORF Transcript_40075/g.83869 Transcript_40075/m.83869 type:complete len:509 (-) Transcript_40075:119-1645(-)
MAVGMLKDVFFLLALVVLCWDDDTAAAAAAVISDGVIETPPRSVNGGRLNDGTILSLDDFMQVSSPAVSELLASMQDKVDEKEETIRQLQDELDNLKRFSSSEMPTNNAVGGRKGELNEHLQGKPFEQSSNQNQSQSQNESPSTKHKEKGHKKYDKHKKTRSKTNKKKAETQRAAIDSFMTSVKVNGKSSAKDWESLVQSMKAENRSNYKEKLRMALSNGRKETKEAGDTVHLIEDVPVPETDQKEIVPKRSAISSQKSVKWKDDIDDSTRDFDDEDRLRKKEIFAATQTPSTTLLINNMNNLSEEDVWEDEDDDDYNYNNIEYDDLPAASYNSESDTTTEKSVDPRESFSKMKSPSTALLIDRMEHLSEELLMEVDHWEGTFSDDDDDDIGNTAPLYEEKGLDMKSDRRRSQRSTILLLKRMEELNEELAVEMDNLNDDDNDGVATKSSMEETVRATGNAKTSSGSPRLPRSTTALVDGMENLGGLLSVENMEDGDFDQRGENGKME